MVDCQCKSRWTRTLGQEKRFPGPISCKFNGITIPGLTGGGVNKDVLVKALAHLDALNVFPRDKGPDPDLGKALYAKVKAKKEENPDDDKAQKLTNTQLETLIKWK